jgi:hypothetical protein
MANLIYAFLPLRRSRCLDARFSLTSTFYVYTPRLVSQAIWRRINLPDHHTRSQQTLKRPGITPEPFQHRELHRIPLDVGVVHVRDLEFAPPGGLERLDNLKDPGVVEVEPGHREVRLRGPGLLLDPEHPAPPNLSNPEPVSVGDLF